MPLAGEPVNELKVKSLPDPEEVAGPAGISGPAIPVLSVKEIFALSGVGAGVAAGALSGLAGTCLAAGEAAGVVDYVVWKRNISWVMKASYEIK